MLGLKAYLGSLSPTFHTTSMHAVDPLGSGNMKSADSMMATDATLLISDRKSLIKITDSLGSVWVTQIKSLVCRKAID